MNYLRNRTGNVTATIGTGAYVLGAAIDGLRSILDAYADGAKGSFVIEDGTDWEVIIGTRVGTAITRDIIEDSSNAGAAVAWGAGTRNILSTVTAQRLAVFATPPGATDVGRQVNIDADGHLAPGKIDLVVAAAGTANAITLTTTPAGVTFAAGDAISFMALSDNTGAVTVAINGGAAVAVKKETAAGAAALIAADIQAGSWTTLERVADGTWQLQDPYTAPSVPIAGGSLTGAINKAKAANVAAAATTNIWSGAGNLVHVTGAGVNITSLGTAPQGGAERTIVFDGAVTLVNGANLIVEGGANYTTAADDIGEVVADSTTQHRIRISRANGKAVVSTTGTLGSIQVFTATSTWNKPAGLVRARVRVVGGGGGGGVAPSGYSGGGGGGGGGGYAEKLIEAATLGASEAVTVGTGGAGGVGTGSRSGGDGAASSFGAHCSATGGAGAYSGGDGCTGGVGVGGTINVVGGGGGGIDRASLGASGHGGSSVLGGGGRSLYTGNGGNGYPGGNYGGGGGGAIDTATGVAGSGAAGIVIVEEFF